MTKAWRVMAINVALAVWFTYSVPVTATAPGGSIHNLPAASVVQTDDDDDDMSGGALAVLLLAVGGAVAGSFAEGGRNSLTLSLDAGNTASVSLERTKAGGQKSSSAWMSSLNRASGAITLTGGATRSEWIGKVDGKYYPVKGHPNAEEFSFTKVDARTLAFSARKGGHVTQSGRIVISANGRSYTINSDRTDSSGRRSNRRVVYVPRS